MRMLRQMIGNTITNRIKNEKILDKLEIATIYDKMRQTRLRWCDHVKSRLIDATMKKNNSLKVQAFQGCEENFKKYG